MKALTLTQPWATLVAIGAKTIETRNWSTDYRGELAIHAAKGFPIDAQEICLDDPFRDALMAAGYGDPDAEDFTLPRGVVVAMTQLADVIRCDCSSYDTIRTQSKAGRLPAHEADFGEYGTGRYGLHLADVVRLEEPVPARGMLGLWEVPADIAALITAQLAGARS